MLDLHLSDVLAAPHSSALRGARWRSRSGFHIILASLGVAFPALMLIANYSGLRKKDPVALELAQRWSKVAAVTFAVGAVTGTVLSFEFGLLWPEFTGRFGEVFGVPFAIEGIFFFIEAIFIAIYIFGWKRLSGWAHFWTGVPIVICGLGGAFSVVAVNAWMNQPEASRWTPPAKSPTSTRSTRSSTTRPLRGPAHDPRRIPGHRLPDRLGLRGRHAARPARPPPPARVADPADGGGILAPIQFAVGDTAAREIAKDQPVKFAAMECVQHTHRDVTEYLGGICTDDGIKGGIGIPGLDSWLVGFSTDTEVTGLDSVPPRTGRRRTRCFTCPSTRWSASARR